LEVVNIANLAQDLSFFEFRYGFPEIKEEKRMKIARNKTSIAIIALVLKLIVTALFVSLQIVIAHGPQSTFFSIFNVMPFLQPSWIMSRRGALIGYRIELRTLSFSNQFV
jgi:hypothetical protein